MKLKYYILLFLLFCTTAIFAQGIKFTSSVSKTEVGTTEQFEVSFTINSNGEKFVPPNFNGFLVVSGPNVSQSMTVINGASSSSMAYSYDLVAVKEGTYTIGPATIVVNGKQLSTSPIKIKVVKGASAAQANAARQQQQQQQQQVQGKGIVAGHSKDINRDLFIRADVNKTSAYIGEQLTLSYRLYTRVALVGSELEKMSDQNGFYSQEIKSLNSPNAVQWRIETIKGIKYNVTEIKQNILFPERAGNITIDPMIMDFIVRETVPSADPFDNFFGGGSYNDVKYKIKSSPVVIHVKPLPESGKPASFSGAVGRFSISASVDKTSLKANEPLNYKITLKGKGNLKLLKPMAPEFPLDFDKYDPKVTDTITDDANGESGTRVYTYLLIPRHGGKFNVDPIKFSYYDLAAGKYVSQQTKGFTINVAKGATENNVTSIGADKQDVKLLNKDIRYIKTDGSDIRKDDEGFYGSGLYYFLLLLGPLAFAGALVFGKVYEMNNSDVVKVKSRKAGKIAAKHLASAKAQLTANNKPVFYENVFKGLYGYLSDKLNIAAADLNREKIATELKARQLDEPTINELLETLDLCDMARFAPVSGISEQEVFEKAKNMINNIEDKI
ncbi:BatD family protein [Mucilaginibacter sp. OK283]|uniref:BatD family protein n=1 Tax=Mucilaginibacter sp. OK283 TaxID=1881049 RepID=UPI0008B099F6|nr:BatD family protein [Mucilaginibacter sp. OK283]SEO33836.1 Oxygen tolerance [Mucilaginibacter sp. OK283]